MCERRGIKRRAISIESMNSCIQSVCAKDYMVTFDMKRFQIIFITVGESENVEICHCDEIKGEVSHKNKSHSYVSSSYDYQSPCREDRIACSKLCLPGSVFLARPDQSMPEAFRDLIYLKVVYWRLEHALLQQCSRLYIWSRLCPYYKNDPFVTQTPQKKCEKESGNGCFKVVKEIGRT